MKPELIPEWRNAWRMLSVQIAALAVVWGSVPADVQALLLEAVGVPVERVPAVLGLVLIVARLVSQPKVKE
jgi:hypothetical protein